MTRQEDILVKLGGDSKELLKTLNMSRQQVNVWARDIAKEISSGHIPEAWKSYGKNMRDATERGTKESTSALDAWGKNAGKLLAKVGTAFVAAFGVREVISALREVSKELDDLYANVDANAFKQAQRKKQLEGISPQDAQTILAGEAQMAGLQGQIKNSMAKAGGLYAFGAGTVSNVISDFARTKDPLTFLFGWGKASQAAAQTQADIVDGMKQAAAFAAAETEQKKQAVADAKSAEDRRKRDEEHRIAVKKAFDKYEEDYAKRHAENLKKQTLELEKQREIRERMATRIPQLQAQWGQNLVNEFLPTVDELAQSGIYQKDARRMQFLAGDTKQAILFGNNKRRDANLDEIQSIRDRLTKAGVYQDPNQTIIDELSNLTKPIKQKGKLPVSLQME